MRLTLVPIDKKTAKADFDCGYPELNAYLRQFAVKNDKLSIGKTFVAITERNEIAGYLTLSTAQIEAKKMPADIQIKLPRYPVPAFRIGKLAVSIKLQGLGVGRWLLTQAFIKAIEISQNIGLFAVIVDAIDTKAKKFYLKYGFKALEEYPLTLFLPLATIKEAIDRS